CHRYTHRRNVVSAKNRSQRRTECPDPECPITDILLTMSPRSESGISCCHPNRNLRRSSLVAGIRTDDYFLNVVHTPSPVLADCSGCAGVVSDHLAVAAAVSLCWYRRRGRSEARVGYCDLSRQTAEFAGADLKFFSNRLLAPQRNHRVHLGCSSCRYITSQERDPA